MAFTEHDTHPARHVFGAKGIAALTLIILGAFGAAVYVAQETLRSGGMAAVISAVLVDLANEDRSEEDLGTLKVNPLLVAAAQAKADDMAEKGYFAHNSPEGLTSWHWFAKAGYSFAHAGENLAVNFTDSEDVERAWMRSPTHRANIMNGTFTEIGIATAVGQYEGRETVFVVQMFGTPRAVAATPAAPREITPEASPEEPNIATTEPEPIVVIESEEELPAEATVLARSGDSVGRPVSTFDTLLASPQGLLRTVYALSALFILGALLLVTRLELKHHHFRHVAAASFLLVLMTGLFFVADQLIFTDPTLAYGVELSE